MSKKAHNTAAEAGQQALVPKLRFPEFRTAPGWQPKKLGDSDVCQIYKGKGISKADISVDGITPCIRYGELYTIYGQIIDNVQSKTNCPVDTLFLSDANDVIIPSSGETKEDIARASCVLYSGVALGGDLNVIRTSHNGIFFSYYLSGPLSKKIAKVAQGDTVVHLYPSQLSVLDIVLPESDEQQKIADCLSSLDELIAAQAGKVEALKAHKKGLMQLLFPAEGQTIPALRFPEFRNAPEWTKKKLIDTTDKNVKWSFIGGPFGSNLKSSDYVEKGIRVIQLQNIGDAEFINAYNIFTSKEKADELLSNNIYPGDIIISKMGDPVGRACLIPDFQHRYVMCSDGIRLVVDNKLHSKNFIYSLINSNHFRPLVEKAATGSTRKRIGLDELKNLPMLLPQRDEQQKIADCLSSLDELIAAQVGKVEALKAHKKGLMQQLFPSPVGEAEQ